MGRGRPKKQTFESYDDQMAYVMAKLVDNPTGTLTLEEMALTRWYWDGCPAGGPITKVGEMKKEAKLLQKIKDLCNKAGLSDEILRDMMYESAKPGRLPATSKFSNSAID